MDLITRREMRRKQRRQKRMRILLVIALIAALIFVMCIAFGGGKDEPAVAPTPTPEATPVVEETPTPTPEPQTPEEFVAAMSLEKRLMQLFVLDIDVLTGVENTTLHGNTSKKMITELPVGGLVYDGGNVESRAQVSSMLSNLQAQYKAENGFPALLGISEEGGAVSPAATAGLGAAVPEFASFAEGENFEGAYNAGEAVGKYLASAGFNMNLAPNCAIPEGMDAETTSSIVISAGDGMLNGGVKPVYKAFPGNVVSGSTKEQMEINEILPFSCAINSGAEMMMVAISPAPVITGDSTACAFSKAAVTDYLRAYLSFDGVVMTAPLATSPADAAVKAIEAGCDLLLMPANYSESMAAIRAAIESGRLTEDRINESVARILRLKLRM
ncbi:MAG: hypothetical protein KIG65_07865 [Eubacteriales bacterium]|nr:hypothetical protein [Eubacteriales bacterium]